MISREIFYSKSLQKSSQKGQDEVILWRNQTSAQIMENFQVRFAFLSLQRYSINWKKCIFFHHSASNENDRESSNFFDFQSIASNQLLSSCDETKKLSLVPTMKMQLKSLEIVVKQTFPDFASNFS